MPISNRQHKALCSQAEKQLDHKLEQKANPSQIKCNLGFRSFFDYFSLNLLTPSEGVLTRNLLTQAYIS